MSTRGPQPAGTWRRRRSRSLNGRALQVAAFALSFIVVALLVVTSSRAAFVAQNDNVSNQVTAASVDLADNDLTAAMFNSTGLVPGTNVDKCIDVTYTGNVDPLPVRLYATAAPTGGLASYLNLTVDMGDNTSDAFGVCTSFGNSGSVTNVYTGTLAGFASAYPNYGTSASTWDPAGTGETRTFRFRVSVQDNALAEGQTSSFGFTWETRSN